jgi:branched-chain amino acid transport system substrate-binding protein
MSAKNEISNCKITRREAISTAGKVAVGAAAALAVGGGLAYYYTSTPTAPKATEVRIGCPFPMTGPLANIGLDMKAMIEIVADKVNSAGGIKSLGGAKLTPIFADTEGKPDVCRAQTRRLIEEQKVVVLTDGALSGTVLTASEEGERAGVPMVVGSSSSVTLTERGFKYFFRIWSNDKLMARQQLEYLKGLQAGGVNVKKIATVNDNTLFGTEAGGYYKEANNDPQIGGYDLVEQITFPAGATDLTSEVLRLKSSGAEVLLTAITPVGDAVLLQRTMKKLDYNFKLLFSSAGHLNPDYLKLGADAWYATIRIAYCDDILEVKPWVKEWADAYKSKTGNGLYGYPANIFTCMRVIIDSVERAASTDPKKIRDAMAATDLKTADIIELYKGVKFDEKGQNIYATPLILQLMSDNAWHIVGPRDVAVYQPIFPQPTWSDRAQGLNPPPQRY